MAIQVCTLTQLWGGSSSTSQIELQAGLFPDHNVWGRVELLYENESIVLQKLPAIERLHCSVATIIKECMGVVCKDVELATVYAHMWLFSGAPHR